MPDEKFKQQKRQINLKMDFYRQISVSSRAAWAT